MQFVTVSSRSKLWKFFLGNVRVGYLLGASFLQSRGTSTHRRPRKAGNHYDTLSLTPKATQAQIKAAYYELSKSFHPDVNKTKEAHLRFSEISEAYETLGSIAKRRKYDKHMSLGGLSHSHTEHHHYRDHQHRDRQHHGAHGRTHVYRGRTTVYNFDEFYKQHYADHKEQADKNKASFIKREEEKQSLKVDRAKGIFFAGIMFGIVIAVWPFSASSNVKRSDR